MKIKSTFAVLCLASCLLFAPRARAQDPDVEARFERGVAFYREADFRSALVEFRRAYDKSKNPKILYNIAQTEYQLTNYVAAQAAFEKYLADAASIITPARRDEVEGEITKIKARIALVTIKVSKPGASVTIDDKAVGVSPLSAPIPLNAGSHRVLVRLEGHAEAIVPVEVGGGDAPTVEVNLVEQASAGGAVVSSPVVDERSWTPAIVAWTATGVFTVAAVVLGVTAQGKNADLEDARNEPNVTRDRLRDLDSSVGTLALLTDVSIGAAVISGALATYFTVRRASAAPSTPKAGLVVRPGLGSLAVGAQF